MRMMPRLFLLTLLCAVLAVQASVIYRWTDEQGQVHMGDKVPPEYRKQATRVNVEVVNRGFAIPAASASAAARTVATPASAAASNPLTIIDKGKAMSDITPSRQITSSDACERQMQAYREAEACWAPYKMKGGTTRAEGYKKCQVVSRPNCP